MGMTRSYPISGSVGRNSREVISWSTKLVAFKLLGELIGVSMTYGRDVFRSMVSIQEYYMNTLPLGSLR